MFKIKFNLMLKHIYKKEKFCSLGFHIKITATASMFICVHHCKTFYSLS